MIAGKLGFEKFGTAEPNRKKRQTETVVDPCEPSNPKRLRRDSHERKEETKAKKDGGKVEGEVKDSKEEDKKKRPKQEDNQPSAEQVNLTKPLLEDIISRLDIVVINPRNPPAQWVPPEEAYHETKFMRRNERQKDIEHEIHVPAPQSCLERLEFGARMITKDVSTLELLMPLFPTVIVAFFRI
ncbi:MAG TPA: hypothetical protein VK145_02450 [Candidatus Nanoarchaeia archaeon]|nr:hypothetical protein [Candidatus Nanoarchaeia archaeon]